MLTGFKNLLNETALPVGKQVKRLLVPYACLVLTWACAQANTIESYEVTPQEGDTIAYGRVDLLAFDSVEKPRFLLVMSPGFQGDGKMYLSNTHWCDFARERGGWLVATTFKAIPKSERKSGEHYNLVDKGSARTLDEALNYFEEKLPAQGLSKLPLLMWGHSAGGQYNHGMACYWPERILGYCAIKGGYYPMEPIEGTASVPALYIAGENDAPRRISGIHEAFKQILKNTPQPAPLAFAVEPNSGHEPAQSAKLVAPFFSKLIEQRLYDQPVPYDQMKPVKVNKQTLTEHLSNPHITFSDDEVSWMPDAQTLEIYKNFVNGEL